MHYVSEKIVVHQTLIYPENNVTEYVAEYGTHYFIIYQALIWLFFVYMH